MYPASREQLRVYEMVYDTLVLLESRHVGE
jgi:hypothetical protein